MLHVLCYEFSLALRRLWRRPVQSGLMLATFSISITLSLLSWSLFHTIFLKNPEFDPTGELCVINQIANTPGAQRTYMTRDDIAAWQGGQTIFSELTPISIYRSVMIATDSSTQRYLGALLSAQAMRMVGAQPLLGRLFTTAEDKLNCAPTLILSQHTWENHFNADPHVLGRVVKVDGYAATIVGVLPASFRFPNSQDVWLPLGFNKWEFQRPDNNTLDALARLKPGYTLQRAAEDLRVITASRGSGTIAAKENLRPIVIPFREYFLNSDMQQSALVLLALSLVFVLVSCANAANLMMIDFFGRTAELAAIISLGLPRGAAIRNICFQVAIVAAASAVLGLGIMLVAAPTVHQALMLMLAPYWLQFSFAWHHAAMAAALAVVCAGVAIIVPVVYLLLASSEQIIRDSAGSSRGTGRGLWRRTLLAGQIALLTVLGIAAGLLVQSNRQLGEEHWGYDASKIFLGKLDMPKVDFPDQPVRLAIFRKIVAEIERLPGVRAAAFMLSPPGYPWLPDTRFALDPAKLTDGHAEGNAMTAETSEGIFNALGVPFVKGEDFSRTVDASTPDYVIINESLAAREWPGRDPIGQALYVRFPWTGPNEPTRRFSVRGVVRNFQAAGPQAANNDFIYIQFRDWTPPALFLVVGGKKALPSSKEISDAVWRVDPRVVPYFPDSIKHQIDIQLGFVRLTSRLTVIYALAAGLLCGVGVYSITVSQILQRNREFGIRLALGIEPRRLWMRFARGHLVTTAFGVAIGLVTAALVMHVLKALLYEINARDPVTFCTVAVAILIIAGLASIPSLFRLRRINPADCLRSL